MALNSNGEMELDEEFTAYIIVKSILALIYSEDFRNDLEYINDILPFDDVLSLELLITSLEGFKNYIDTTSKENVYNLVCFFRSHADTLPIEEKKYYYELCNQVLSILRESDDSNIAEFVYIQCKKRQYTTNMFVDLVKNYKEGLSYIRGSLMDDVILLVNHTELLTDEEFENDIDIYTALDTDYMSAMSTILCEMPVLFKNETFYNRVMNVTALIGNKVKKSKRSDYTTITLRDMKKVYSKYKKFIYQLERK